MKEVISLKNVIVDTHIHTYKSDGEHSIEEILKLIDIRADQQGLNFDMVFIGDHDNPGYFEPEDKTLERMGYVNKRGLYVKGDRILGAGIEMTARHTDKRDIHLEALFFDNKCLTLGPDFDEYVRDYFDDIAEVRWKRAKNYAHRLQISDHELYQVTKNTNMPSRLHLAKVLYASLEKRFSSAHELMKGVLTLDSEEYVAVASDPHVLSSKEMVEFILRMGAIPVWVHPEQSRDVAKVAKQLNKYADGIFMTEVFSGNYDAEYNAFVKETIGNMGIGATYGSDFHGKPMKNNQLGIIITEKEKEEMMNKFENFLTQIR